MELMTMALRVRIVVEMERLYQRQRCLVLWIANIWRRRHERLIFCREQAGRFQEAVAIVVVMSEARLPHLMYGVRGSKPLALGHPAPPSSRRWSLSTGSVRSIQYICKHLSKR